jgi:hypothetical protein
MTHGANETLSFNQYGKRRSLKDAAIVAFLVIVLGAFVAQIARAPSSHPSSGSETAAVECQPAQRC